jgi:abequosyltransferase
MALVSTSFILTIAIPTYNRSLFLKRSLDNLQLQLKNKYDRIELIVSDNASMDDTKKVVSDFIETGMPIRYLQNTINKGPDFNITQCYVEAKGKYVIVLGDDDILKLGSIDYLMKLIEIDDFGLLFLKSNGISSSKFNEKILFNTKGFKILKNISLFKEVTYFTSFISANVINKSVIDFTDSYKYVGTNLNQVPIIISALFSKEKGVIINDILLLTQPDNTGGYDLFKVFGKNFIIILDDLQTKLKIDHVRKIVENSLLLKFFPVWIIYFKENKHRFNKDYNIIEFQNLFKSNIYFWLVCKPIMVLPKKLSSVYLFLVRVISKIFRLIFNN